MLPIPATLMPAHIHMAVDGDVAVDAVLNGDEVELEVELGARLVGEEDEELKVKLKLWLDKGEGEDVPDGEADTEVDILGGVMGGWTDD